MRALIIQGSLVNMNFLILPGKAPLSMESMADRRKGEFIDGLDDDGRIWQLVKDEGFTRNVCTARNLELTSLRGI